MGSKRLRFLNVGFISRKTLINSARSVIPVKYPSGHYGSAVTRHRQIQRSGGIYALVNCG